MNKTLDLLAEVQWLLAFAAMTNNNRARLNRIETYLIERVNRD